MRIICSAKGINLYAPNDSYISFSNSPYIGHRTQTAVDIYPAMQEWGAQIPSPISGRVVEIKKLKMGKEREFLTSDYDYAIAIQPESEADEIVRILHCRPNVELNQIIEKGDSLGDAFRSRYFNYWTGPHAHVDVMRTSNFTRSSKSYELEIPECEKVLTTGRPHSILQCDIHEVTADFIIATSKDAQHTKIDKYIGHCGFITDSPSMGILDAGFPYYKQGGLMHLHPIKNREQVHGWNIEIGTIERNYGQISRYITNMKQSIP